MMTFYIVLLNAICLKANKLSDKKGSLLQEKEELARALDEQRSIYEEKVSVQNDEPI